MKPKFLILTVTLGASLACLTGCGPKQPEQPPEQQPPATTNAVTGAVEALKPAAEQAAKAVTDTANTAVADATAKANALIEQAKTLIGQTKYTEALNTLQQLGNVKLTPEQEKLVASLKEQIQKAMAAGSATTKDAANAAGNLLKQ
jgi:hypothetical protein